MNVGTRYEGIRVENRLVYQFCLSMNVALSYRSRKFLAGRARPISTEDAPILSRRLSRTRPCVKSNTGQIWIGVENVIINTRITMQYTIESRQL